MSMNILSIVEENGAWVLYQNECMVASFPTKEAAILAEIDLAEQLTSA
jgi:hypothetical protein